MSEYGFLVDADKNRATGATDPAIEPLGIDARLAMRCDQRAGRFVSPIGRVTMVTGPGSPSLELVTTVGQLPSVDFFWTPYGAVGNEVVLLAAARRYSRWAIAERMMP